MTGNHFLLSLGGLTASFVSLSNLSVAGLDLCGAYAGVCFGVDFFLLNQLIDILLELP
jgi:hypothetical protein